MHHAPQWCFFSFNDFFEQIVSFRSQESNAIFSNIYLFPAEGSIIPSLESKHKDRKVKDT